MDLYKQFCSREQALELQTLGVHNSCTRLDKDGYKIPIVGCYYSCTLSYGQPFQAIIGDQEDAPYEMYKPVKHYSVAELGVMLGPGYYTLIENISSWRCWSQQVAGGSTIGETEAEARAAMLIRKIKAGIIQVENVNKRLADAFDLLPEKKEELSDEEKLQRAIEANGIKF